MTKQSGLTRPITGAQIIVESLYALLALGSIVLFGLRQTSLLSPALQNLAQLTDYIVCILFATKAVWDLWRAPNKLHWWKWGWADFAASIPEVEFLRFLRGLRLLLIIRVMRSTTRSVNSIVTYFNVGRARAVVATVFSLIVVSIVMSSFLILGVESTHPESNINDSRERLVLVGGNTVWRRSHGVWGSLSGHCDGPLGGALASNSLSRPDWLTCWRDFSLD